jgi:hypothetical protein
LNGQGAKFAKKKPEGSGDKDLNGKFVIASLLLWASLLGELGALAVPSAIIE